MRRFRVHQIINILVLNPCLLDQILAQRVAEPTVRPARCERTSERVPEPRRIVAEHLHIAVRIFVKPIEPHRNIARRADYNAENARLHQPRARRLNHRIAAAEINAQSLGQTGLIRRRPRDLARQLDRFVRFGENCAIQARQRDQLVRPATILRVHKARSGRLGHIDTLFAGQSEANVILRAQKRDHPFKVLRFVFAHPKKLSARVTGEHSIVRVFQKPFHAARARRNPVALLINALITPEHRRTNHPIILIQRHQPVHLSGHRKSDQP